MGRDRPRNRTEQTAGLPLISGDRPIRFGPIGVGGWPLGACKGYAISAAHRRSFRDRHNRHRMSRSAQYSRERMSSEPAQTALGGTNAPKSVFGTDDIGGDIDSIDASLPQRASSRRRPRAAREEETVNEDSTMVERSTSDMNPPVSRPTRLPWMPIASTLLVSLAAGTTSALAQGTTPSQPGRTGLEDPLRDPMAREFNDKVKVNEHMIVDLHVQDEDLSSVLQMLSLQTQRNILTSKNVSATVTANLYGVTFHEALEAILSVNGYAFIEKGNFIYVYTLQELIEIEKATRQRVHKVIKLSYLNGVDAAEFAKGLLSEGGQIKTNGKPADFAIPDNAPVGGEDFALDSTLVVFDYEENVGQIEQLLEQLDTKPIQVLVEATILQTALSEANAFGVDFTILGSLDFVDFVGLGGPLESVNALIGGKGGRLEGGSTTDVPVPRAGEPGNAISSTPGNTGGPATLKLGIVDGDVAAFLRVLDEVTDTTILSRPNLLTLNRQPARVLVGRKVGYLSTTSTDTATTQTVQFLDTGTQLYFRPFVSADGMIRMELKPQVSEAVIRNATDATGAAVTIPDEITNEIVANVLVRDGQTIVLGGLFRESTQATRRQVPFVGDLPFIGAVFRGHEDTTTRNEIIFMITPTIVNDRMLVEQGSKAMRYMGHVRAGAREGLLPFSREKQSSQLLVTAQKRADEGKTDSALYYVQRSLALNPVQPDAINLRERLVTRGTVWPSRRMMDDIVGDASKEAMKTWESQLANPSPKSTPPQPATQTPAKTWGSQPKTTSNDANPVGEVVIVDVPEPNDPHNMEFGDPSANATTPGEPSTHTSPTAVTSTNVTTPPNASSPTAPAPTNTFATNTPTPVTSSRTPGAPSTTPPAPTTSPTTPTTTTATTNTTPSTSPSTSPSQQTPTTQVATTQPAPATPSTSSPVSPTTTPTTPITQHSAPTPSTSTPSSTNVATNTPSPGPSPAPSPMPSNVTPSTPSTTSTTSTTSQPFVAPVGAVSSEPSLFVVMDDGGAFPVSGPDAAFNPVMTPADVMAMLPTPIRALVQSSQPKSVAQTSPNSRGTGGQAATDTPATLAETFDATAKSSLLQFSTTSIGLRSRIDSPR